MSETSHLEQKIGRFKFFFCKDIKIKMVADSKRRRSSFIKYICKRIT